LVSPFYLDPIKGEDEKYCGIPTFRCQTINSVFTDKIQTTNPSTLSLMNGEYAHTSFNFDTKNIRYEGESMDGTKIKFNANHGTVVLLTSTITLRLLLLFFF
jgi:hypothetical protein